MKSRSFIHLLFVSILMVSTMLVAHAENPDLPGQMTMVGTWHGDEVSAQNGETWLALHETFSGFELQEIELSVQTVVDEVIDVPPSKTGKKVSASEGSEPIALFRGLSQLKAGPVIALKNSGKELSLSRPITFILNGQSYRLEFKCFDEFLGQELADCPLQLSDGNKIQALQDYPVYHPSTVSASIASDVFPQVLWAGDLDHDGFLDLLLDLTNHYNVAAPTLLLSGMADKDELVRPVAVFRTTGC